jgi:hypothetical protein
MELRLLIILSNLYLLVRAPSGHRLYSRGFNRRVLLWFQPPSLMAADGLSNCARCVNRIN